MPRRSRPTDEEQLISAAVEVLSTPQGRRTALFLAIVVALALGAWLLLQNFGPQRALHTGPSVRIATWNLHEFSPRPAIDLRRIAEIITSNQFDVLAVQEVKREGEEVDALLNVLGSPWRGTSFSPMTGNHERFVFLYNADHVREVGPAHPLQSPRAGIFQRLPYEDTFQAGNFTFTLVTVHLDWSDRNRRREEAEALAELSNDHVSPGAGDKDVIILGDFNEQHEPAGANLHYLEERGWERLIHDATNLSSTEDFDNILIDPRTTPEWTGRSGVVNYDQIYAYPSHKQAVDAVSDHRPSWADFATGMNN